MKKDTIISYSIGDIIPKESIAVLTNLIDEVGIDSFRDLIWDGEFSEYAFAYIHPCDEMLSTPMFDDIQKCYINAYT